MWRSRRAVAAGLAAAVMAAVVLVAVLPLGGGPHESLAAAAEAADRPTSLPAPAPAGGSRLAVSSDGIRYPDWGPQGWRATGVRRDRVAGRPVVTVAYARGSRRFAYAIAARPAMDLGDGDYTHFTHDGRPAVAWDRDGRTCLLVAGEGVDLATLRRIARSTAYY